MQGGRAQITRICTITGNMGALKSATQIGGSGAVSLCESVTRCEWPLIAAAA